MEAVSDAAIWDYALQAAVAIITKDEDFAQRKGRPGSTGNSLRNSP
jgi:predicted nuclease of predicted toxin-antitoxin system